MQAGRLEEALAHARRAVEGARICLPEHGFLASVLLKLGRIEDAEQVIRRAVELAPGVADAYDGLASMVATCEALAVAPATHRRPAARHRPRPHGMLLFCCPPTFVRI